MSNQEKVVELEPVDAAKKKQRSGEAFWSGRKVFVTGHTGFKGAWLTGLLASFGAEVHGYSLAPSTEPSLFVEGDLASLCATSTISDIRDREKVAKALKQSKAEVVFHLAAQPMVLSSYEDPVETYDINVTGTASVLEAVRGTASVRSVVVVTTDKCYDNREWAWPYRETDRLGGHDPYSNSKACCELVVDSFRRSFFLKDGSEPVGLASVRAGNIIGGGDWGAYRLLPDYFRAYQAGTPLEIRRPDAIRPWQHVLEALNGYLQLAKALTREPSRYSSGWNFGPDQSLVRTVKDVLSEFQSAAKRPVEIVYNSASSTKHEANILRLDCSKAHSELGWETRLDFRRSALMTLDWYERWMDGESARELINQQIADYFSAGLADQKSRPLAQGESA